MHAFKKLLVISVFVIALFATTLNGEPQWASASNLTTTTSQTHSGSSTYLLRTNTQSPPLPILSIGLLTPSRGAPKWRGIPATLAELQTPLPVITSPPSRATPGPVASPSPSTPTQPTAPSATTTEPFPTVSSPTPTSSIPTTVAPTVTAPTPTIAAPVTPTSDGVTPEEEAEWEKVSTCEEGSESFGDAAWHTVGSTYSGGLGISETNWSLYGGEGAYGNEANATPDEQIVIAMKIQSNPPDQSGCTGSW